VAEPEIDPGIQYLVCGRVPAETQHQLAGEAPPGGRRGRA
jgi:hypothetical protein